MSAEFVSRDDYNRLRQSKEAMYGRLLATLAAIISLRDEGTGGHCERVAHNATVLAQNLSHGISDPALNHNSVYWAGVLHDLGKVAIPEDILNKPGELDKVEWELMKQHADIGADCIIGIGPEFDAISLGIRHHHERWDGGGYPEGLCETQIPVAARCVAIADVFEAMTTKRSYHKAMSERAGIQHICDLADTHLWGEGVECFAQLWDERLIYSSRHRFIPPLMATGFS